MGSDPGREWVRTVENKRTGEWLQVPLEVLNVKPRALVARRFPGEGLALLQQSLTVEVWEEDRPIPREELLKRIENVEGLLSHGTEQVDEELMDRAPRLKVVSNYAVGFDNIDVAAATKRGIMVTNTPGVLTNATADLAFALLLAAARRIGEGEGSCGMGNGRCGNLGCFLDKNCLGPYLESLGWGGSVRR